MFLITHYRYIGLIVSLNRILRLGYALPGLVVGLGEDSGRFAHCITAEEFLAHALRFFIVLPNTLAKFARLRLFNQLLASVN